mgnify:CR=1 FL=1
MSIRKYIAYLRTVETGSITQAANELGYTQSAVSKMISDLEPVSYTHLTLPTKLEV